MQPYKALIITIVLVFFLISCGNKRPVQYTSYYEPPAIQPEVPKSQTPSQNNFRKKIENLQVEFIDKTNKVPKHIIEYLARTYGVIEDYPRFAIKPYFRVEGYHFVFENNAPNDLVYYNYPNKLVFTIVSAQKVVTLKDVNPLPVVFEINDQFLSFQAIYKRESNKIKSIKLYNNTRVYVHVDTISGYYHNKITERIVNDSVTIPPMGIITYDTNDINFPINLNINVNQFKESPLLLYGYSVKYKLSNMTTSDTLHKLLYYGVKAE